MDIETGKIYQKLLFSFYWFACMNISTVVNTMYTCEACISGESKEIPFHSIPLNYYCCYNFVSETNMNIKKTHPSSCWSISIFFRFVLRWNRIEHVVTLMIFITIYAFKSFLLRYKHHHQNTHDDQLLNTHGACVMCACVFTPQ